MDMNQWRREIEAFLRSKWAKPVLGLGAMAAFLALAYQLLVAIPDRRAQQQRQVERESKEWLLLREPLPVEDRDLEERHQAWDEIERKRIDPEYEIPPHKLELIRKHWADLTNGWTKDQVQSLEQRLERPSPPPAP